MQSFIFCCGLWCSASDFHFRQETENLPEQGEVTSYVITCGSNKFTFLPPQGWGCVTDPIGRKLTFENRAQNASISIRFETESAGSGAQPGQEELRRRVAKGFPGATLVDESKCYTNGQEGRAFDLEESTKDYKLSRRVALVPCPGGTIEFILTTGAVKLLAPEQALGGLLTSFRMESRKATAAETR